MEIVSERPTASAGLSQAPHVEDQPDPGWTCLILGVSEAMDERIEELAHRTGDTKADLINKAIGLYKLASDAARAGKRVVIVDDERDEENEIVGF